MASDRFSRCRFLKQSALATLGLAGLGKVALEPASTDAAYSGYGPWQG